MRIQSTRSMALLFALVLLLTCSVIPVHAEQNRVILDGQCSDTLSWVLYADADENITLAFEGTGEIPKEFCYEVFSTLETMAFAGEISYDECWMCEWPYQLILPEGITAINESALRRFCGYDLVVPSTVKVIGDYAFGYSELKSVTLPEGLESIGEGAFMHGYDPYPVVIPESVVSIGDYAFDTQLLCVYPGSEGERYCVENEYSHYRRIPDDDPERSAALVALVRAMCDVEDVPVRYRIPAIETVQSLDLTAAQAVTLTEYVRQEELALKSAMRDNDMSLSEMQGFLNRFLARMEEIGVSVSWEIATINGYYGVELSVTANDTEQTLSVYRNNDLWVVWGPSPASFEIEPESLTLFVGDTAALTAFAVPEDTSARQYWSVGSDCVSIQYTTNDGAILQAERPGTTYAKVRAVENASINDTCVIHVRALDEEAEGSAVLPAGLEHLRQEAFAGTQYVRVYLPDGVKSIGAGAFRNCTELRTVRIPDSLEEIAPDAFEGCSEIKFVCSSDCPAMAALENMGFYWFIYED